jgi:hypothetical protein
MRNLALLLALLVLAVLPAYAGVGFSGHAGGGFGGAGFHGGGGYRGGYHSFRGGRGYGFYGGGFYGYSPYYGYDSYGIGYDSGSYYEGSAEPDSYTAPDVSTTQPPTQATNPAATPTGPLPAGKVDQFGFVHSPYSTSTFKSANVVNGQVFYDPTTGQPFIIHVTPPAPASAAPSSTLIPAGKLDEFGYVHSPFSTFTFKVQNGNYAQTFRDPFTGQAFTVNGAPATDTVASTKVSP